MGRIWARSGKVVVTTVAPDRARWVLKLVELGKGAVEVRARSGHVVHPDAYGDEVGTHGQCRRKLFVDDVADPPAAHREVGVGESGVVRVDDRSQPIGESDEPGRVVAVP